MGERAFRTASVRERPNRTATVRERARLRDPVVPCPNSPPASAGMLPRGCVVVTGVPRPILPGEQVGLCPTPVLSVGHSPTYPLFRSRRTGGLRAGEKRSGWDSNPRCGYPHTAFPVRSLRPLGHRSRIPGNSFVYENLESSRRQRQIRPPPVFSPVVRQILPHRQGRSTQIPGPTSSATRSGRKPSPTGNWSDRSAKSSKGSAL